VNLRKVPGALALGLLASLIAHSVLYGGDHMMAAGYHALLLQVAAAGALSLLVFFGSLAWSGARGAADGSILAARLTERLPALGLLLPATLIWFAAAEGVEPNHATAPPIAILLALIVASWLLHFLARGFVAALARAIIAISRDPFAPRTPLWSRRTRPCPAPRRFLWASRRFARPPPIALVL
jgi:hypothetical protein